MYQAQFGHEAIAHRLQDEALIARGKVTRRIAGAAHSRRARVAFVLDGHWKAPTCVAVASDAIGMAFTGGKDGALCQYDIAAGRRVSRYARAPRDAPDADADAGALGHTDEVLAVAVSSDGRFAVSGSRDKTIKVWDPRTGGVVDTYKGHRGAVTALAFRDGSLDLYSGGADRVVKVWDVNASAYVETLYGHQSEITAMACLQRSTPITAGADSTLRIWKVAQGSQVMFRARPTFSVDATAASASIAGTAGGALSVDAVAYVTPDRFVSGGQDGALQLWSTLKKKPISSVPHVHGSRVDDWVVAVAARPYTDLVASGGRVRHGWLAALRIRRRTAACVEWRRVSVGMSARRQGPASRAGGGTRTGLCQRPGVWL